jgi:methionyl-tRNA formyltransferase
MRILFIGSVEFSCKTLQLVISGGGKVVGVCTLEKSPFNSDHVDLSILAKKCDIPVLLVKNINSPESIAWIRELKPDVVFCFGWSRLLGKELLSIPHKGVIGFHPAALPANRGRHPIIWALALGLKETASTFFFMDESADSGDILSQRKVAISEEDDARSLYDKVTETASSQILEFLPELAQGCEKRIRQDHGKANSWRKRSKVDGVIDWRMPATGIHNLIRALAPPYPGAHFVRDGAEFRVLKAKVIKYDQANIEPGKIVDLIDSSVPVIKCGIDALRLDHVEPVLVLNKGDYL